jgi:hypothetical protein
MCYTYCVQSFLGVSVYIWGVVCLGLAVLYIFVWPRPRLETPPRPVWAEFVLRYLHSLVWALLAGACFLWGLGDPSLAYILGRFALLGYMIYFGTLLLDRSGRLR